MVVAVLAVYSVTVTLVALVLFAQRNRAYRRPLYPKVLPETCNFCVVSREFQGRHPRRILGRKKRA